MTLNDAYRWGVDVWTIWPRYQAHERVALGLFIVLSIYAVYLLTAGRPSLNLVKNGGFEEDTRYWAQAILKIDSVTVGPHFRPRFLTLLVATSSLQARSILASTDRIEIARRSVFNTRARRKMITGDRSRSVSEASTRTLSIGFAFG
jgi:hypothetical protein